VLAVPKSIDKSVEKMPRIFLNMKEAPLNLSVSEF